MPGIILQSIKHRENLIPVRMGEGGTGAEDPGGGEMGEGEEEWRGAMGRLTWFATVICDPPLVEGLTHYHPQNSHHYYQSRSQFLCNL